MLIKQDAIPTSRRLPFLCRPDSPIGAAALRISTQNYSDLLSIDLSTLVAGEAGDPEHLRTEPLYLVCTNGKRDQCCSIYGPETYQAMNEEAGEAVWQCSHIGGHNQAPITLFFPHGVNYGHTTPSEIRRLIRAYQAGEVVLHHYRGRVCFEPPVQAAEHFWREQSGILNLPGVNIESAVEIGENLWEITVSGNGGDNTRSRCRSSAGFRITRSRSPAQRRKQPR